MASKSVAFPILLAMIVVSGIAYFMFGRPEPISSMLEKAKYALKTRQIHSCADYLDKILVREPNHVEANFYRAKLFSDRKQDEEAIGYLRRIPTEDPKYGTLARIQEGVALYNLRRVREAEPVLKKAFELAPKSIEVVEALTSIYLMQIRTKELRALLDQVSTVTPLDNRQVLVYIWTGRGTTGSAMEDLQRCIEVDPEDIVSQVALGEAMMHRGKLSDAESHLAKLFATQRSNAKLFGVLANVYFIQNKTDKAAEVLRLVPSETESELNLWLAFAQHFQRAGKWTQAKQCYANAIQLDGAHITAVHGYAMALRELGQTKECEKYSAYWQRLQDFGQNITLLSGGLKESPHLFVTGFNQLGKMFLEFGMGQDAYATLRRSLNLNPNQPEVATWLKQAEAIRQSPTTLAAADADSIGRKYPTLEGSGGKTSTVATSAGSESAAVPAIQFVEMAKQSHLNFQHLNGTNQTHFILQSYSGGVSVLDYDNDGWPDLYFPQGEPLKLRPKNFTDKDHLFRNNRDGTFSDISASVGLCNEAYGVGACAGDFDNDGFDDLVVNNNASKRLYQNNGDGTFSDITPTSGVSGTGLGSSVAFADFDKDGQLDLYFVHYVKTPYLICHGAGGAEKVCHPGRFDAEQDTLFVNRGARQFVETTHESGIVDKDGKGLGIVVADYDGDGWPDIYIANDTTPNFLYLNQTGKSQDSKKTPKFKESGFSRGCAVSGEGKPQAGMGIACGDFDNNGALDLLVTNYYLEGVTLYSNSGKASFEDTTRSAELTQSTISLLGFGTQAIDVDMNGALDLFVANGHVDDFRDANQPYQMPPLFFYNLSNGRFLNASKSSGEFFNSGYIGRAVAKLDWNRDGKPDIVMIDQNAPSALLTNQTPKIGNELALELVGTRSNRSGLNVRCKINAGGKNYVHEVAAGDGFLSTNEKRQLFGLGTANKIEKLEITWPSGHVDQFANLPVNKLYLIVEGRSIESEAITTR